VKKWVVSGSAVMAIFLFLTLVDFRGGSQNSVNEQLMDETQVNQGLDPISSDSSTGNTKELVEPSNALEASAPIPETGSAEEEIEIARLLDAFTANAEFDLEVLETVDTETAYKLINIAWGLADIYLYEDGIPWADDAIRLDPGLPDAHLISGYLHFKLLNTEKAISAFEKTIELDPHNFDAHMYLGRIYNGNENPTLGMEYLTKAIEIASNPTDISLGFAYRAFSHALLDQYDKALDDLEDALFLDPDNGWATFFHGIILEEIKEKEEALGVEGVSGESLGITK
jgi:tetratricopeptide (TPR) repeat protein